MSHEQSISTEPGGGAEVPSPRPLHVFLAEDDAEMRGLIATLLRRDGFEVSEACDGSELVEALRAAIASPPDLVISDVEMPRGTGLRVLATVKRTLPHVPVVLITAFGSSEVHREAGRLGAAAVLDKPFRFAALREIVAQVLGEGA